MPLRLNCPLWCTTRRSNTLPHMFDKSECTKCSELNPFPSNLCFLDRVTEDHLLIEIFSFLCSEDELKTHAPWGKHGRNSRPIGMSRTVLRLVCSDFTRVLGLVTEALYLPCAAMSSILRPTHCWSCLCPKLTNITICASNLLESRDITEAIHSEGFLPFCELFSRQPIDPTSQRSVDKKTYDDFSAHSSKSTVYCRHRVGINVIFDLPTKSTDGLAIIQGLLWCLNKCCEHASNAFSQSSLFVRHLDLSDSCVTDACLSQYFPLMPELESVDLRRCHQLKGLFLSTTKIPFSIRRILLDGCWRIDEGCFVDFYASLCAQRQIEGEKGLFVDILHEEFPLSSTAEVAILTEPHAGEWVRCTITHSYESAKYNEKKAADLNLKCSLYDVFVWETLKFDHAVGFSCSPALGIARKHLRHCTT